MELRFFVCIRTYNRPKEVRLLLGDLAEQAPSAGARVMVFDDGSAEDVAAAKAYARSRDFVWYTFDHNHGKEGAWQVWTKMFAECRAVGGSPIFVFLDDDMRLCTDFFERARRAWSRIRASNKATLTLMVDDSREHTSCWTGKMPERCGDVVETGWVDGAWLCERKTLAALRWRVPEMDPNRWRREPHLSTGVGWWISNQLVREWRLFRVRDSLVFHAAVPSQLNPEARKKNKLRAVRFVDGQPSIHESMRPGTVRASIASIPERLDTLRIAARSLAPQVTELRLWLNGYRGRVERATIDRLVGELVRASGGKLAVCVDMPSANGDIGDVGKFAHCECPADYNLTCDDDIEYPSNYVAKMCAAIDQYRRCAVVGVHGCVFHQPFRDSYRSSRKRAYHFASKVERDYPVHMLGTGCMGYHASTIAVRRADFRIPNMADIWFALLCQARAVPRIVIRRPENWLKQLPFDSSIWNEHAEDGVWIDSLRSINPWELYGAEGARG